MDTRKFIYRCPLLLMLVAFIAISIAVSCSHNREQFQTLQNIENLAHTNPDSALSILNEIDFSELEEDSLKAYYYLILAAAHKTNESPMVSDSLVRRSFEYYRNRDYNRFLKSADLYSLHLFWSGNGKKSLALIA